MRRSALGGIALALFLAAPAGAAQRPLSHDVNGDGLADVVMTDYIDTIDAPGATVLFGRRDRAAPRYHDQPGDQGFRIVEANDDTLADAEIIGDVNGDGLADILVTDGGASDIFVVFGKRDTATVHLTQPHGSGFAVPTPGFKDGTSGVWISSIAVFTHGAGDVNGDGLADLIHVTDSKRLFARIRLGSRTKPLAKSIVIRPGGRIRRKVNPDLAPAGDMNGDGLGDVALTVVDPDGRSHFPDAEDMVFVVWGRRKPGTVTLTEGPRPASAAVRVGRRPAGRVLRPARKRCWCETARLDPLGDVNGDGLDDLGVAWEDLKSDRGYIDALFGSKATRPVTLPGRGGATLTGADWSEPFTSVGDADADGRSDLLVPASPGRSGLRRLNGSRVRGTLSIGGLEGPLFPGVFGLAERAGDVDGDGYEDFLLGNDSDYSLVYGPLPQAATDFKTPASNVTPMPLAPLKTG